MPFSKGPATDTRGADAERDLEQFRSYLLLLARVRLDPMARAKAGASADGEPNW